MNRRPIGSLVLCGIMSLVASGGTFAQEIGIVVPNVFENSEAPRGSSVCCGSQGTRVQIVFDASEFTSLPESHHTLTGFSFRPDGVLAAESSVTWPQYSLKVSTTTASPSTMSTVFAHNVGGDELLVHDGPITIGTKNTGPFGGPKDFDMDINFETPFHYDPAAGNLLFDYVIDGPNLWPGGDGVRAPSGIGAVKSGNPFASFGTRVYDFVVTRFRFLSGPPTRFTWQTDGLGDWLSVTSWKPAGGLPNDEDFTAVFGDATSGPTVVGVSDAVMINRVEFDHSQSYAVTGLGSIHLTASSDDQPVLPSVAVNQGIHEFQVQVDLQADTSIDVASSASLTFNNALNLNGYELIKIGEGTVSINNLLNAGGGTIICEEGTCSGRGTIGGDLLNVAGIVSPGNSVGTMTVDGSYTQDASAVLQIEIAGAGRDGFDVLDVTGNVNLEGGLNVISLEPFALDAGDSLEIINVSGTLSGMFADLSEGGFVGTFGGEDLFITYMGGDGNDVALFSAPDVWGDYNGNGRVEQGDLDLVLLNWGDSSPIPGWDHDQPADGTTIGQTELDRVRQNWGAATSSAAAAVPEPAGMVLVFVGVGFGCVTRRRLRAAGDST